MEDERYLVEGEFVFNSYVPARLMVGMHFLTQITVGTIEPEWLFFTLGQVPDDMDMFMSLYGAPVNVHILSSEEDDTLADPKEIGWFHDGNEDTELRPITDDDITHILNKDDGFMDVECDDTGDVILFEGKVILSFLSEDSETLEDEE